MKALAIAPQVKAAATMTYTKVFSDGRQITASLPYPTLAHAEAAMIVAMERMHVVHKMLSLPTTYQIFPISIQAAA